MRSRSVRRFAALFVFLAAGAFAADMLHIIPLRHRPAEEIAPLIRPLLRSDEGLAASGYQLVLRASAPRRSEVERMIAALDVAPRQLTLTVRHSLALGSERRRDSVGGDVAIGSRGRVGVGDGDEHEGRRRDSLRYRFERRTTANDAAHTQMLRVQDGSPAFIRVGQSAPVIERIVVLSGRAGVVAAQGIALRDFSTGFDVLPRVRGDVVHLTITPRLAGPRETGNVFRFQELQTTVTARIGEWIDIGAVAARSSDVHRAILESASTATGERAAIAVKVE